VCLGIALLAFAASWTRFPNFIFGCVDYAERGYVALIDYMSVPELHPDLRIIYIDDKSFADEAARSSVWRMRHAQLLRALSEAGARAVAFDFTFADRGTGDEALAAAIRDRGATRVVIGGEPPPGLADGAASELPVSPALKAVLGPGEVASLAVGGSIDALATSLLRRRVLLAEGPAPEETARVRKVADARTTFPLRVKVVWEESRRGRDRITARIDMARRAVVLWDGVEELEVIPCAIRLQQHGSRAGEEASALPQRLRPATLAQIAKPYTVVESWIRDSLRDNFRTNYSGKVVLVASNIGDFTFKQGDETIYGYSIHASAINALLLGRHPAEPGIAWQFALLAFLAAGAAAFRRLVPRGDCTIALPVWGFKVPCPVTLLAAAAAYLLIAAAIFAHRGTVLDVVYGVAALVAGYYVSGWPVLSPPSADAPGSARRRDVRRGTQGRRSRHERV
jgi:CHASE2 domain-containing sensor protein